MQIKKFKANNMTEALTLIKREFGTDAVILSAKTLSHDRSILSSFKKKGVEVTAATDNNDIEKNEDEIIKKNNFKDYKKLYDLSALSNKQGAFITSFNRKMKNKKSTKKNIDNKIINSNYPDDKQYSILDRLIEKNVDGNSAQILVNELNNYTSTSMVSSIHNDIHCLAKIVDGKNLFSGPVEVTKGRQKVLCFAGAAGVGKTSTIVKLAAYHSLMKSYKVAVLTLDNYRIGSANQLSVFSNIIGFPVGVASNYTEIKSLLRKYNEFDLIFIDTPGISLVDEAHFNDMKNIIHQIDIDDVFLVLSSNTQLCDLKAFVDKFNDILVNRLIFTKTDESLSHGNILSLLLQKKIPVSYFTNGPNISGDIEVANARRLVDLVFSYDNDLNLSDQNGVNTKSTFSCYDNKKIVGL